ncbi:MAG: FAD-binding oxidoreductase [Hyphomicrobiales bacterium]|nr:FAD-binding oxidoreductase [Hyphomicrobiales bacterium]
MGLENPKIIIVGAGIVGASIAYHLTRRGAAVTVIDGGEAAEGATARSFAWINAWSGASEPYARLRHHSLQEYRRLQHEFNGTLPLKWCGTLVWKSGPEETEQRARDQAAAGYDVRLVGPDEIARIEPNLRNPPATAAYAPGEGCAEPEETTRMLLQAAQEAGAALMHSTPVDDLVLKGNRITGVRTAGTIIGADTVVVAAGTGANALAATVGVDAPMEPSPAVLAHFRWSGPLIRAVVINPALEVRQITQDVIVAAANYIDDSEENGPEAVAVRMLSQIRAGFAGADMVQLDNVQVGWRPMPADGLPIVGFAPKMSGLYLSVMHSGITLAPAIGRFAAVEILDEVEVRMLDICRPQRFLS